MGARWDKDLGKEIKDIGAKEEKRFRTIVDCANRAKSPAELQRMVRQKGYDMSLSEAKSWFK